jgi:hypothetical protein
MAVKLGMNTEPRERYADPWTQAAKEGHLGPHARSWWTLTPREWWGEVGGVVPLSSPERGTSLRREVKTMKAPPWPV